jgi:hypothetical protein
MKQHFRQFVADTVITEEATYSIQNNNKSQDIQTEVLLSVEAENLGFEEDMKVDYLRAREELSNETGMDILYYIIYIYHLSSSACKHYAGPN